jgi:hypothetical protein
MVDPVNPAPSKALVEDLMYVWAGRVGCGVVSEREGGCQG